MAKNMNLGVRLSGVKSCVYYFIKRVTLALSVFSSVKWD